MHAPKAAGRERPEALNTDFSRWKLGGATGGVDVQARKFAN